MQSLGQPKNTSEASIGPCAVDCLVPLLPTQLGHWRQVLAQGGRSRRFCATSVFISGPLRIDILRQSLKYIVQRHEPLRSRVVVIDGTPRLQISESDEHELNVVEISGTSLAGAEQEAVRLAKEFVDREIDLCVGPLFEVMLFRFSSSRHALVAVMDHMICDATSNVILEKEIWTLYGQAEQGQVLSLPNLPVRFSDYAIWQEQMHNDWLDEHGPYWKARLAGAPSVLIPSERGRTEVARPVGTVLDLPLGKNVTDKLRDFAKREGTSLPRLVLAIQTAVISRWCNQTDLVVSVLIEGRTRKPELKPMIGFIARWLYLRIAIEDRDTFIDLLRAVNLEFANARAHDEFCHVSSTLPVIATDLTFNWLTSTWSDMMCENGEELHRLWMEPFPFKFATRAKFNPLFYDTASGVFVRLTYRPDLVSPSTAAWFVCNVRSFAERVTQCPFTIVTSMELQPRRAGDEPTADVHY